MSTSHEFQSAAEWVGGKRGRLVAPGLHAIDVASPPEFGGPGFRWTPEHLFVSSAATCAVFTFVAMAEYSKLPVRDVKVRAKGLLDKAEGHGFAFTTIDMEMDVEVEKPTDVARAERIVAKVEANCLVSNSMKTEIHIAPHVIVAGSVSEPREAAR